VLFDASLPPPVADWGTALLAALACLVQLPALLVNNVYTGDVGTHRKNVERVLTNAPGLLRFVSVSDTADAVRGAH
jgi:hypothetical protein